MSAAAASFPYLPTSSLLSSLPCLPACLPYNPYLSQPLSAGLPFPQASPALKDCIRAPPTGHTNFTAVCNELLLQLTSTIRHHFLRSAPQYSDRCMEIQTERFCSPTRAQENDQLHLISALIINFCC